MDPKTYEYGETISYLKLNGTFTDEISGNEIVSSTTGYSFISDKSLGSEGNGALQLQNNKNIIITNVLNSGTPVELTVPDPYTLLACTTSFWIKQYSTSNVIEGYHPIKITAHLKNELDEDIYFTYTNKTANSFDLEIRDANNDLLASQSIPKTVETIADNWLHVSFITYKGKLTTDNGSLYDGYIMDLFVDGEHIGFSIYEEPDLPVINRLVSVSIAPYDTGSYLSNAAIADLKIVNKLEYYPTDKSKFVPEEVNNGPANFIFIGENINNGIARSVEYTLHHDLPNTPNVISRIDACCETVIEHVDGNDWANTDNLITTTKDNGAVNRDAVYFSGNTLQGYVLNRNILWGLNEFTIAAWVKNLDNTVSATLLEIVPSLLLDLTEEDLKYLSDDDIQIIEDYKAKFNTNANSINVSIYDNQTVPHGLGIDTGNIEGYKVGDWNYIATTFKNNVVRLFVNGKLIQEKDADLELNLYSKLSQDMYSIIGASFVDDLPSSGHKASNMYMDDFIIYDKAIFTEDFEVPTTPMVPYYMLKGILHSTSRQLVEPHDFNYNTERHILKTLLGEHETRRIVLNPSRYVVFRFSV